MGADAGGPAVSSDPMLPDRLALDDAAVVRRVRAGDAEAFSVLVRRHELDVYRYARGMGLDHDGALDQVQEALVAAFTRLDQCREPERFRIWLLRIVRNRCLDQRKADRRRRARMEVVLRETDPPRAAPDELRHVLGGALAELPPALREAFLLRHDQGYTYDEIAELMGASPSAVKMRVHRAREQLRRLLDVVDGRGEGSDPGAAEELETRGRNAM